MNATSELEASEKAELAKLKKLVKVKKTQVGRGLFALQDFAEETVIGEIFGQVMGLDYESNYSMDLGGKALLEPAAPFRFLNHCCQPNSQLLLWKRRKVGDRKLYRIWLMAIRDITAGEELTIDYAWPEDAAMRCLCGAAKCRGWIVDPKELKVARRQGRLLD